MRFAIFNNAYLNGECSGMVKDAFQYQTDEEQQDEFESQIQHYKKLGYFKEN